MDLSVGIRIMCCLSYADKPMVDICRSLESAGVELLVLSDPRGNGHEEIQAQVSRVESVVVKNRLDKNAVKKYEKLVDEFQPQVIYAVSNKTLSVALIATRRHRDIKVVGYRGTMGHLSRWDPASWLTYLHPRLAHIVCVSNAVKGYLKDDMHINPEKLTTIYKGHDVKWYENQSDVNLKDLGVPENSFVVAFVGNMRPVKGTYYLLSSLKYLPQDSKVHLLMVGEVRDSSVQKLLADKMISKRSTFVGYRKDATALLNASDAFVMPSIKREGLPRAVFEAMALKKPVVVTDVGGMKEQICNGVSGIVVPPENPKALADAFVGLENDSHLCEKYALNGYIRLKEKFNINITFKEFLKLFRKLAE